MSIPLSYYLILSAVLFSLGLVGVMTRRNVLVLLMSIELMINSANLTFLAFAKYRQDLNGQVIAFFNIAVPGATGGDVCESDADCDDGALKCVPNFAGSMGSCGPNEEQPLICQTRCATDADCTDAEYGHNAAPKCLPDCQGNMSCTWDPRF